MMTTAPGRSAARAAAALFIASATASGESPRELLAFQERLVQSVDQAARAVVKVRSGKSYCSGVIVHPGGLVATNNRVAGSAGGAPSVILSDGSTAKARVIANDADHDLCLLAIEKEEGKGEFPHLPAAAQDPEAGAWVAVIGKAYYRAEGNQQEVTRLALADSNSVTFGSINGKADLRDPDHKFAYRGTAMLLDAQINPGCEGGAVIDAAGTLVGIVAQLQRDAGTWDEMDFAIPASAIRALAASVSRPLPTLADSASPWSELAGELRAAAARVMPSLVRIEILRPKKDLELVPPKGGPGPFTGVVLDAEGHILTSLANFPDEESLRTLEAVTHDNRRFPVKALGRDLRTDLLLLKADGEGPFAAPETSDPGKILPAQLAIAVGVSYGSWENPVFHPGVISALDRYHLSIQTDAMLLQGNRGGALVDREGRLIGVLTQFCRQPERDMEHKNGIAFAVPLSRIQPNLTRLKSGETLEPPWMGVGFAPGMNDPGCMVTQVAKEGPAEKAGLKTADLVLEVDGHRILNHHQFQKWVLLHLPGETVALKVERIVKRKPQVIDLSVTLGQRKDSKK